MNCTCSKCGASFTSKLAHAFYSLFFICCINSYSQNCNNKLSIEVVDLHDGTALSDATVVIKELDIGGKTDKDGLLVFENLCSRSFNLIVSHDFKSVQRCRFRLHGFGVPDSLSSDPSLSEVLKGSFQSQL